MESNNLGMSNITKGQYIYYIFKFVEINTLRFQ